MCQSVFLTRVHGQAEFAAPPGIHEFDVDVVADSVDVALPPVLKGIRRGRASPFLGQPLVGPSARMGIGLVGRAPRYVDSPAVRPPPRKAGGIARIRIRDAPVMFFLV